MSPMGIQWIMIYAYRYISDISGFGYIRHMLDLIAPHFSDRQSFRIRMAILIPKCLCNVKFFIVDPYFWAMFFVRLLNSAENDTYW